jgi:spore maturation protein B
VNLSSLVIPLLLTGVAVYGMGRRVDVYGALTAGAGDGLTVMLHILPSLVALLTAVAMFRASGAMEWLTGLCAPVLERLGIPAELTPLMLIRPVSGGGALGVGNELIAAYGPDSYIGRVAAVMLGSTETTFYTIAVYFGAAGIRRTRHTIPAALTADVTGFIAAAWTVRLFFGAEG